MKKYVLIGLFLLSSCSSLDDLDTNTDQGAYALAERYEKAERYEEAIRRFSDLRAKFPYSKLAIEAQLKIADIEFKRKQYEEAASAYQIFREMNPRYARLEYVIYQTALSFYLQLPKLVARDLSSAKDALRYFDEYLQKYPSGTWAEDARKNQRITYEKLADKEMYIGDYYLKQRQHMSALSRYSGVANNYSFLDVAKVAALKAMQSALKLEYKDIAQEYFDYLKRKFPDSEEFHRAREEGANYGIL